MKGRRKRAGLTEWFRPETRCERTGGHRQRSGFQRGISLLVLLLLLLQTTICGFAEDEIELYDIYTTTIKEIQSSAGTWNKEFSQTDYDYALTLTGEEEGFSLSFPLAEWLVGPNIQVEAGAGSLGSAGLSQELGQRGTTEFLTLLPGEYRQITITTTPQQTAASGENQGRTYTVRAYRSPLSVECAASAIQETEKGKYLTVSVKIRALPGQTGVMNTFGLALAFDPAQLKLAKASTLTASTKFYDYASPLEGLLAEEGTLDKKAPFVLEKQTASNVLGKLILWMGPNEAAPAGKRTVSVSEEGTELLTLTFRVMADTPFFEDDTLKLLCSGDSRSESPVNGVYVGELVDGVRNVTSAAPGMIRLTGLDQYAVTGVNETQEHGTLALSPKKEDYREGQKLTVKGVPDPGYEFLRWEWADSEEGEALRQQAQTEGNGSVSFFMRGDLDLSPLNGVFVPAATELPSGALIDRDAPYEGNLLLALNPPSSGRTYKGIGTGITSIPEQASLMGDETDPVLEYKEDIDSMTVEPSLQLHSEGGAGNTKGGQAGVGAAGNVSEIPVGGTKVFTTRNMLASGSADQWIPKTFEKIGQSSHVNIWMDQEDPVLSALTAEQVAQLQTQFETSWQTISGTYHSLYDSNENGRLDVLLYDIQDGYEGPGDTYYQGLFSFSQLYGRSGGDAGDFIHLDTWPAMKSRTEPQLSGVLSTMAHETGHMAFASLFQERGAVMTQAELDAAMPTWISEGLSMSIEDSLFGVLESRLSRFSQSAAIRRGSTALGTWDNTVDSYALTYLFFQYLIHQAEAAGVSDFTGQLYRSYEGGAEKTLLAAVSGNLAAFADATYDDLMEDFFLAVVLKEAQGRYGFGNDPDFDSVNLRPCTEPTVDLPRGGAALFYLDGSYTPEESDSAEGTRSMRYTGLRQGSLTLSVSAEHGTVSIRGDQVRYEKGKKAVITANPGEEGWTFLGWKGDASGTENPLVITMDRSKTITAVFEKPAVPGDVLPGDPNQGSGLIYHEDGSAEAKVKGGSIRLTLDTGTAVTADTQITAGTKIRLKAEATDSSRPFLYWVESLPQSSELGSLSGNGTESVSAEEVLASSGIVLDDEATSDLGRSAMAAGTVLAAAAGAGSPSNLAVAMGTGAVLAVAAKAGTDVDAGFGTETDIEPIPDHVTEGEEEPEEEGAEGTVQNRYYGNPGIFTYTRGATYRAVFGALEVTTNPDPALVDLSVIAPDHKTLLQRARVGDSYVEALSLGQYGERHYNSAVEEYDLYLLSPEAAEKELTFRFRWKRGQVVRITHRGDTSQFTVGEPVPETESELLYQAELSLPMETIAEGGLVQIAVSDETAGQTENYLVHLHRNTVEQDPQLTFSVSKVEEKEHLYRMELRLKNLWLGAVDGALKTTGNGVKLADVSGIRESLSGDDAESIAAEQWSDVTALPDWNENALEQASLLKQGSKLVFNHRRAWSLGEQNILQIGLDPGKTAATGGAIQDASPVSIQEDTVIAEVYFFCETDPMEVLSLLLPRDLAGGKEETGTGAEAESGAGGTTEAGSGSTGTGSGGGVQTANLLADVRYTAYDSLVRLVMAGEAEITGTIHSYDPKKGIALRLISRENPEVIYDGSVKALETGAGAVTQTFSLRGEPGTYSLVIEKPGHLSVTLTEVTVTAAGLNLTEAFQKAEESLTTGEVFARGRIRAGVIQLLPGDVDGDGHIGIKDKGLLSNRAWYGTRPGSESTTRIYDLDGDGLIGMKDWNLMSGMAHYGKRELICSLPSLMEEKKGGEGK